MNGGPFQAGGGPVGRGTVIPSARSDGGEDIGTARADVVPSRKILRRLTEPYPTSQRVVRPEREANLPKVLERGNWTQTSTGEATPRSYPALRNEYYMLREALEKRDEQIESLRTILETRMKMSSGQCGGMSVRAAIADKAIQCSVGGSASQEQPSPRSSIIAGLILLVVFGGMAFLSLRGGAYQLEQLL